MGLPKKSDNCDLAYINVTEPHTAVILSDPPLRHGRGFARALFARGRLRTARHVAPKVLLRTPSSTTCVEHAPHAIRAGVRANKEEREATADDRRSRARGPCVPRGHFHRPLRRDTDTKRQKKKWGTCASGRAHAAQGACASDAVVRARGGGHSSPECREHASARLLGRGRGDGRWAMARPRAHCHVRVYSLRRR